MPRPNPPPLTSKKAKALYKKSGKCFEFTPSQFRAAERREELDERRKKVEAKEERKQSNKRKREAKEERERVAKRRLLDEGKVRPEDTLPKVHASQPRLNAFFKKPALPTKKSPERREQDSMTEDESEFESEDDTCVDPAARYIDVPEKISEDEMVQFFSTGPSRSLSDSPPQKQNFIGPSNMASKDDTKITLLPISKRDEEQELLDAQLSFSQSFWDFVIAEDDSAEVAPSSNQPEVAPPTTSSSQTSYYSPAAVPLLQPSTPSPLKRKAHHLDESFSNSPSKSARSALSEMSPSRVNIRAQERPDTTSAPKSASYLPSPGPEVIRTAETPADIMALISTQDLEDDELLMDKENEDPWRHMSNQKPPAQNAANKAENKSASSLHSKEFTTLTKFDELSDCEDLFDFETDFDDEGLDDATLAGLSTQMSAKNTFVSVGGSPKKARFTAEQKPAGIMPTALARVSATTAMLPPPKPAAASRQPSRKPLTFTKANSFSFDGVDDDDLVDLADELEEKANSQDKADELIAKKSRNIPWLQPPQFLPPSHGSQESVHSSPEE